MSRDKGRRRSRLLSAALVTAVSLLLFGGGLLVGVMGSGRARDSSGLRPGLEVPATAMDLASGPANNSPVLLADPTEDRFVVMANRIDAPDFGCALQVSGDGGRSWITAPAALSLPAGAERCYAPEVAFDRTGVLYYLFVALAGRGNKPVGAYLATSTDRARTFGPARQVLGPNNFSVRMAIDRSFGATGRMHLVWVHATSEPGFGFAPPPNPVLAAHSDDGGRSFSEPVHVSGSTRRLVAPAIAVGADHAVHVAYYDLGADVIDYQALEGPAWEGTWSVVLATSEDGDRFERERVVDSMVEPAERVMLIFTMPPPSVIVTGKRVCVSWTDARNGDADAVARCSSDQGRRWAPLVRLNDDPVGNGHRQYLPRLSVAPGGRIDAIFYDRRNDPQNRRNEVFYTYSGDGGRHFSANVLLTRHRSDAAIGPRYAGPAAEGQVENGGRLGLLSTADGVLAAWGDSRNHLRGTGQDIFSTQVVLPPGRQTSAWPRLAGLALVILGLWLANQARKGWRTAAVGVATATVVAGCSTPSRARPVLPPPPPVVDVTMRDHRFEYDPAIPPGRVVFRVRNAGKLDHELGLFPIGDDFPPIDVQLHGPERRPIVPFGRVPVLAPGDEESFAVDLVAGRRYAMICFLKDADGHQHDQKGMNSEFRPEALR